jgi:hypothetical protein
MPPYRTATIGLQTWLSFAIGLLTILVLLVATGILSQRGNPSAQPPPRTSPGATPSTATGSPQPTDTPSGSPPPQSPVDAANQACTGWITSAAVLAGNADQPQDADELAAAIDSLNSGIRLIDEAGDGEPAWARSLNQGRSAIHQWQLAIARAENATFYAAHRAAGLTNLTQMTKSLARLGADQCASVSPTR